MKHTGLMLAASVLAIAVVLTSSSALAQQNECDSQARICVTLPAGWTRTIQGNTLVLTSPQRDMALELRTVRQVSQFAQARNDFERELTGRFRNLNWDNRGPVPVQQGGMAGVVRRGNGFFVSSGEEIGFFMIAMAHDVGGVVGLGIVTARNLRQNWPIMEAVLNSIRRM